MVRPNKQLYEELIDKGALTIADQAHNMYIFDGYKYLPINFENMSVSDSINYLVCLYNIIGKVDASHQALFEADPIVDHLFNVSYFTYKNGKQDPKKWGEVAAARKNQCRIYIDKFLEKLQMQDDPNSAVFKSKLGKSEEFLKAAFDNDDIKIADKAKIPQLAKDINDAAERYAVLYPTPRKS